MNKSIISLMALFLLLTGTTYAQQVGIKTNALSWATTTPNIGLEVGLNQQFTPARADLQSVCCEAKRNLNLFAKATHALQIRASDSAQTTTREWLNVPLPGTNTSKQVF